MPSFDKVANHVYTMLVDGARRAVQLRAACGAISCAITRLDMILQAGIVDFVRYGVKVSDDEIEQQT